MYLVRFLVAGKPRELRFLEMEQAIGVLKHLREFEARGDITDVSTGYEPVVQPAGPEW